MVVGERKTQTGRTKVASANDPRKVTCDSARVSGTLAGYQRQMLRIFVIVNETDETDRNRQTCVYDPGLSKSLPRETLGRVGTLQRATARTRESEQTTDTTRTGVNTKSAKKVRKEFRNLWKGSRLSRRTGKAPDFPEGTSTPARDREAAPVRRVEGASAGYLMHRATPARLRQMFHVSPKTEFSNAFWAP